MADKKIVVRHFCNYEYTNSQMLLSYQIGGGKTLLKGNTLTFSLEDLLDDWFGVLREAREGVYYIQRFIIPVRVKPRIEPITTQVQHEAVEIMHLSVTKINRAVALVFTLTGQFPGRPSLAEDDL